MACISERGREGVGGGRGRERERERGGGGGGPGGREGRDNGVYHTVVGLRHIPHSRGQVC